MVTLMPCSYLSAPRCAGLIEKMIEIEPKVPTIEFTQTFRRRCLIIQMMDSIQINIKHKRQIEYY